MIRYFIIIITLSLYGCSTTSSSGRLILAEQIASAGGMVLATLHIEGALPLFSFHKHQALTHKSLRVYIEGDGYAYVTRYAPSPDPTPLNPITLRLAAADTAPNVLYLARPCQYIQLSREVCSVKMWTSHRYSVKVLDIYNAHLDALKEEAGIESFELIGYSGGGSIATLLAGMRDDVTQLRTVAANLNTQAFTDLHHVTPMLYSANPLNKAGALSPLPQIHFVGEDDDIVPAAIARSFLRHQNITDDIRQKRLKIIPHATHSSGWFHRWPKLLTQEVY